MEIKTKFNVGDEAWAIIEYKAQKVRVVKINIYVRTTTHPISRKIFGQATATYDVGNNIIDPPLRADIPADEVFSTKTELLESL